MRPEDVEQLKGIAYGVALTLLALLLFVFTTPARAQKPDILEVVEIAGVIDGGTAERIAKAVDEINDNNKIKAVLLVLDTPGGTVTGSSAIREELSRLKVPVVVWCQSLCASGGVYVSTAPTVKWIAVREQTITGSVGVVLQSIRYHRLLDWAKIDPKTYRSGALKDAGNGTRPLEDAEDKYLQAIVQSLAEQFYGVVGKSRKIKDWDAVKSARIFIGAEAVKVGLADAVMTRQQAEAKAKELSGAKTIFTRAELKKMSSAAHGDAGYQAPPAPTMADRLMTDAHYLVEVVREIHAGEAMRASYLMTAKF